MRWIIMPVGCLAVLMPATALPVEAGSKDPLGSGATAPTGLSSGATLWLGLGPVVAGGAGTAASRRPRSR